MPKAKHTDTAPATLALYQKLIAGQPGAILKGDKMPYVSVNGRMQSYLEKDGSFGLCLPDEDIPAFLKKYRTTMFVSYGIVKKDFVLVPETLFKKTKELQPYFNRSFAYLQSLKPKPTKK